jgi:hypothetical protein
MATAASAHAPPSGDRLAALRFFSQYRIFDREISDAYTQLVQFVDA